MKVKHIQTDTLYVPLTLLDFWFKNLYNYKQTKRLNVYVDTE